MLVLDPLGRPFGIGQCEMLPVTGLGLLVKIHKAIHGWQLSVLALDVCERGQAAN